MHVSSFFPEQVRLGGFLYNYFPDEKTCLFIENWKFAPLIKSVSCQENWTDGVPLPVWKAPVTLTSQEGISLTRCSARKMSLLWVCPNGTRSKFLFSHLFEIFLSFHAAETPFSGQLHPWALAAVLATSFSVTQVMLCSSKERWTAGGLQSIVTGVSGVFPGWRVRKAQLVILVTVVSPLGELPKPNPSRSLG